MSKAAETLNQEHLSFLSCNKAMVQFGKGDSIIKQGMFSTNIVYLRSGLVKIHITGPYQEQIVRLVKAPSYLGLPTSIGDKINQYSVTSISDAEVCFIDMVTFRQLLKGNELFSYEIIHELCHNELEAIRRCANRTQKQVRGNIADVILEFADHIYESDHFTLPISQAEIGNLVDTSRESISRTLSEFHRDGIIRFTGKKIEILNKKSLVLISQTG
ncbi:MAG: Crp/Fnr family transcriptional regulator [Lentimicrobium sp.]|jgi:CRP/FNR family transcriptional regulator|nr:Crp/Fnr family transcriptional regulator [Lentimicrobium sp.]